MSFLDTLLWPLEVVVAWIMVGFHSFFTWLGLGSDSGNSWVLSIVGLVIVMRIVLIPLFVKQIKASRGLQLIQPQLQKLQAKYKGKTDPASRQAMQQEMMALYREAGTNPFSSCLPILAQSPVFFALFRVLNSLPMVADGTLPSGKTSIGPLTPALAASAESSTLFGAPLSATFMKAAQYVPPDYPAGTPTHVRIVTVVLIILMSVTTFTTQRQLTMKNMPASALDNPMARQQRVLMYILPLIFAVSGINFPIGVLVYWFTTNVWSMGQQFYVIRRMPAPGSEAEKAYRARKAKRAERRGGDTLVEDTVQDGAVEDTKPVSGQRVQPVRKDRKRPSGTAAPGATGQSGAAQPAKPRPTGTSGGSAAGSGSSGQRQGGTGSRPGTPKGSGQGSGKQAGTGSTGTGGARQGGQRPPRTTASGERTARPTGGKPAAPRSPGTSGPTSNRPSPKDGAPDDSPSAP